MLIHGIVPVQLPYNHSVPVSQIYALTLDPSGSAINFVSNSTPIVGAVFLGVIPFIKNCQIQVLPTSHSPTKTTSINIKILLKE